MPDRNVGECGLSHSGLLGTLCLRNRTSSDDLCRPGFDARRIYLPSYIRRSCFPFWRFFVLVPSCECFYALIGLTVETMRRSLNRAK
jgi:hypothetical protein